MVSVSKILVEATVIIGDKFSSGIIATRRSRIEETSENEQDCCWRWPLGIIVLEAQL